MTLDNLQLNKVEEYKNFNIDKVLEGDYSLSLGGEINSLYKDNRFNCIHIVNGIPISNDSVDGINIEQEKYIDIKSNNPFTKINSLYNKNIYNIIFSKSIEKPILIINYYTIESGFTPSNIKITLLNNIEIDLIETSIACSNLLFINNRVFDLRNSVLNYSKMDMANGDFKQLYNYYVFIDSGVINAITLNNSGQLNINNWRVKLGKKDALCKIYGIIDLKENMYHGTICKIKHFFNNTKSVQEFRHILDDNSCAMYDGTSYIDKEARNSEAFQEAKTIMLSNSARIYVKPRLNIFTGEVKAKHGATIGKLNEENIFYLRQRGLPEKKIKKIIIKAFINDFIDKISSSVIKEFIYEKI